MALILSEREHSICFKLATNRVTSARLEIKALRSRAEKVSTPLPRRKMS